MDELTLDDKKYLSSKRAAQVTGYAKDYVGQLCREGRIEARLVGRNWYVLESSILEHRFGAEVKEEAPASTAPVAASVAWNSPRYEAEQVVMVPEIRREPVTTPSYMPPVATEDRKVLTDMQSAWQEWFQTKEKSLPEPSEMLLADHVEGEEPGDLLIHEAVPEQPDTEETEEVSVAIHVERDERPQGPVEVVQALEEPEYVPVRRVNTVAREIRQTMAAEEAPTRPLLRASKRQGLQLRGRRRGHSAILRAIFIAVAGLAIAVAAVGTGVFDRFANTNGPASAVTDSIWEFTI